MNERTAGAESTRARILRELRELIAALDRRIPQVHRVGEAGIARAAAALRAEAETRIAALEREAAGEAGVRDRPSRAKSLR